MKARLVVNSPALAERACGMLRSLDGPHEVTIKPHKSNRSIEQNRLHWKRLEVVRLHIADSTGQVFSAEELHEFFKEKFLPARIAEIAGEAVLIRRTTTNLNTKEMSEFMDAIDRYCIERLNLYLPVPGMEEVA